jgi:dienelactone hydrolase
MDRSEYRRMRRASLGLWALWALIAFVLGALSWAPVRRWAGAVQVLSELGAPASHAAGIDRVTTTDVIVTGGIEPARARLYEPRTPVYRCVVVGHGVHHLGIDEPRLIHFARALAGAGVEVLTPELRDLADYRITRVGADVLGAASRYLARRCPRQNRVGLVGFSFAGGLSLLAAADPSTNGSLAYVASVGGYHDLERVLRFLVTGTVQAPASTLKRAPHEYGLVVLLYGYLDHFVPNADLPAARRAVRAWLEEDRPRAWAEASHATTFETEQLFVRLSSGRIGELKGEIGEVLRDHAAELDALSPRGHLRRIPVPVYLLHGSGDSVIPPEETLWAARELGTHPHLAVVTPLIEHVEMSGKPRLRDQLALIDFMAHLL